MYTGSHRAVHTACATIPRSCGRGLLLHPRQALVQRHCNAGTIAVMRTDAMLVGFKRTDRHTVSQSARRNATSLYTSTMLTDIFPPSDSRLSSSQSTPVYNPPPPPPDTPPRCTTTPDWPCKQHIFLCRFRNQTHCVRNTIGFVGSNIRYAGYSACQSGWSYLAESERSVIVRQKVQQNQTNLLLVSVASWALKWSGRHLVFRIQ